jgi:hypothetical protein
MLHPYNNVDDGDHAGDWVDNCSNQLVQNAALCSGIAGVNISPTAEIEVLDVVGFTLAGSSLPALSITKSHSGSFAKGERDAQYLVTVSNASGAGLPPGP